MQNLTYILILIVGAFLFSACTSLISKRNLPIHKGYEFSKFEQGFSIEDKYQIPNNDKLKNGKYMVYKCYLPEDYKGGYYIYAFKDDKLIYWGHPFMFNRHSNLEIRAIGEATSDILAKE